MWKRESFFQLARRQALVGLMVCGLLTILGTGSSDDKKDTQNDDDALLRSVTASVRTNQSYTLTHHTGAQMHIPLRAVPATEDTLVGTMVFSITSDATPPSTRTTEGMSLGPFYRFGSGGFVYARPVRISIPVLDPSARGLTLMVYDEVLDFWVPVPGAIDPDNRLISAYTQHFSYWSTGHWTDEAWATRRPYGWGTLHGETPVAAGHVYSVCIEEYSLAHPEIDGPFFEPTIAMMTASSSRCGMRLPQGTYSLGVTAWDAVTGRRIGRQRLGDYTITAYDEGLRWEEGTHILDWPTDAFLEGMGCFAEPTSSPGTGEVQATLVWWSSLPVDLDLHVTDPLGETVFFGNRRSESGGVLDIDNRCADFVRERPENIYWLRDAPTGEYIVTVVYLSDCLNDLEDLSFEVRIVNKGDVEIHRGAVAVMGAATEVARFTVR